MSWVCNLTRTAERELTRVPKAMQRRIASSIDEMEQDPFQGDVRPLRGAWQGFHRKRVGRYRIIFRLDAEQRTIDIAAIRPRSDQTY
jgi:mRNA-degrading endonuclease RelE of RelBE toxin-antitoxin system